MNRFLIYHADKNSAHRQTDTQTHRQTDRQTDRHTPMTTRPCGLRRAGNKKVLRRLLKVKGKFRSAADPLPGGAGRPKFNQLETVTTFIYKPSLVRIDARKFELSW